MFSRLLPNGCTDISHSWFRCSSRCQLSAESTESSSLQAGSTKKLLFIIKLTNFWKPINFQSFEHNQFYHLSHSQSKHHTKSIKILNEILNYFKNLKYIFVFCQIVLRRSCGRPDAWNSFDDSSSKDDTRTSRSRRGQFICCCWSRWYCCWFNLI